MNEIEYILRIVLKARDELAGALAAARAELNGLASDMGKQQSKINAFNQSMKTMEQNVQNVTDKFQEWRDLIQGTAGGNEKAKKSVAGLNKELEDNVKAVGEAVKVTRDLQKQTKELGEAYIKLDEDWSKGKVTRKDYVDDLNRIGQEYDKLSKRSKVGTEQARNLREVGRLARETAKEIVDADKEVIESERQRQKVLDDAMRQTKVAGVYQKDLAKSVRELYGEYKKLNELEKTGKVEKEYALKHYQLLAQRIDNVSKSISVNTRESQRSFEKSQQVKKSAQEIIDLQNKQAQSLKDLAAAETAHQKSLDEAIRKTRVAGVRQEDLAKSVANLYTQYQRVQKAEDAGTVSRKYALQSYQQLGREIDNVSKKLTVGGSRAQTAFRRAESVKAAAKVIIDADNEELENKKRVATEEEQLNKQRIEALQRDAQIRSTYARAGALQEQFAATKRGKVLGAEDVSEVREVSREMERLASTYDSASTDARRLRADAEELRGTLTRLNRESEHGSGVFGALARSFSGSGSSVAGFDNQLRGLGILVLVGFAQQLITVLEGLAGGFIAVAASAGQAGAAIGGAFVAGIAQALPVIGLLGAAFHQAQGAMEAMKAAQLARQQAFTQGAEADKRVADATDTVKNAQEGLANAHRQLADAQENLTKAREDGREELDDLIKAENDAKLAAMGAALSQKEAQEALIKAQATGDTGSIQRAQLGVLQAQADAQEALNEKKKAGRDAERGRAGGVEGTEGVQQARKQVEDAERAVARANRQVQTAKRNAGEAAEGANSAASKLQFLLSQMTRGQVALFRALEGLRKVYQDVFGPINDIILGSFTRTVRRITALIQTPEIVKGATKLATEVSKQLNRITDAFLGDKMIAQFLKIAEAGRKNLKPITDIVIDLGKAFLNIAQAAGPSFSRMIRFVGDLVKQFTNLTGNQDKMTKFFDTGEKHFEAWIKLGLAVIRLFLALAGAGGARTGLNLVEDATKAIDGLIKKINSNKGAVAEFFEDSRDIVHEVVGVIVALAEELHKAFTPERVDNFAKLLKDVIIPALGDVIEVLGNVTAKIVEFAETPIGGQIAKAAVAAFLLSRIMGAVVGAFKMFAKPLIDIGKAIFNVGKSTGLISGNLGGILRIGARFLGIAGIVIFLLDQLGLLDDAWEEIKEAATAFFDQVMPPIKRFIDAFKDLFAAVSSGKGAFGPLISVLRTVMKILIEVGGFILEEVLKAFGQVFGGIIDIITGFINIFTGIMTGDFGKIWEGVKDILRGAFNAILGLLTLLFFRGLGGIFKGALGVIKSVGGGLIRGMINLARTIAFKFIEAVERLVPAIGRFIGRLPKMFFEIAKDIISFFWRGFRGIGKLLRDGIELGWRFISRLPGRIFDIAKDIALRFWRGYRRIGGYIREGIEAAWGFVRRLPGRIFDIAKDIVIRFWRGYRAIGRYIRKGIEDVWDWIKGLPKRLGDIAVNAAKAVVDAFKGVGKKIIGGIVGGLKELGSFAKDIANAFIDLLNNLLPNKLAIPGFKDVDLPNNPIKHLAAGGPVPGSGTGDKIHALLEPGEHVLTRQEVAAMGGHSAVFTLRRMLGGGGQASGPGMLLGGSPGMTYARQQSVAAADDPSKRQEIERSNEERAKNWRIMWNDMVATARRAANDIEKQFRDMRVATARSADRMYREVRGSIADIEKSFDVRGKRIVKSWADMWMSLKKVTAEGLNYIGHETNKALTSLGEKHINFGFSAPKKADTGKAGGGFIGGKGHRGRDQGFYALGPGEAVLNWQHQAYVEPAMNAYYGHGLTDMYRRTRGYHAGGPEQPGFAAGGHTEIDATGKWAANPKLAKVIAQMMKRYKFAISAAGEGGHSANSDHHWGGALDLVPGTGGSWALLGQLAKAAGWRPNVPTPAGGPFRWIGWNTESQHGAPPRPNAHLHLSWRRGGPFAGPEGMAVIEEIGRVIIKGIEPLKDIAQVALDKVRKAANKTIDEIEGETTGTQPLGPGGAAEKIFDYFVGRGLSEEIAAGFVGTFKKESNFNTTVLNKAGSGAQGLAQWLGGRLTALKAKPNWQTLQTQLDYVWEELQGPESKAFAAIKRARTAAEAATIIDGMYERSDNILNAPEFATEAFQRFASSHDHGPRKNAATGKVPEFEQGGIVPGPKGAAVPIIAHAQEWILNSGQVNRLAGMIGTSRTALRSMMGFYGGPGGAAGGTEVESDITPLTTEQVKGIDARKLRKMVVQLRKIGRVFDDAATHIGSVEEWSGYLGRMGRRLDRVTKRLKAGEKESEKTGTNFDRGIRAFMDGVDIMLRETTGVFAKLRASIERRTAVAARKLLRRQFDVEGRGRGVTVSRTDLGSEERVQEELARREQREAVRQRGDLVRERNRITQRLRRVRAQQERKGLNEDQKVRLQGQETQLQGMLDDARQRVTDNVAAIYEAQQAYLEAQLATQQAITDGITHRYELANANIDRQRREATSLGNVGQLRDLAQQSIANLNGLANEINGRIDATRAIGTREAIEAADAMAEQVKDLRTQVIEATAQVLRDDLDRVNTLAQRALSFLDIRGRVTELLERAGGRQTAAGQRVSQARERSGILEQQRRDLAALRNRAALEGNTGVMEDLDLQLAELDATIAENNQTTQELIIANHQLTAEIIKSTTDRTTGLLGVGQGIIEKLGKGFIDPAKVLPFLQAIGTAIRTEAASLVAAINTVINDPDNPFGAFATRAEPMLAAAALAFQAGPEAFAEWLLTNAPAIAQLIEEMGGPGSPLGALFGGLIDELGENTVAMLDNTQATDDLTGNLTKDQGFTSTAFELFSQAIFTGSGGIMPYYQTQGIPTAQAGAEVASSGMLMVHSGERIVPAKVNSLSTNSVGGETNIFETTINEAGRPINWADAATQIMFKKSGAK